MKGIVLDSSKKEAIINLIYEYAMAVDDGELKKWPDFFSENGSYYVYPRDNYESGLPIALIMDDNKSKIKDRVTIIEKIWTYNIQYQRHIISNIIVKESADRQVRAYSNFVIHLTDREGNTDWKLIGKYVDTIVFEDESPKIEKREVILDTFTLPNYFVNPL
ncbi:aromatic-ring-hydroxylating dioxygenase subunit beta [Paenibacillus validus]|uniref:Aromatic-ring-hydroxylating dioxygenase subunit beta n=1 Tax=Paenibacillus validus TaxID=44253 RepID=A0A7X2Z7S4_9BACL|nr:MULTISPECIES: aromatic-ring-hydroxylating dioxygenase subunit beta [Paenibacillus]MED4602194.1 aromatic-ring-hydroxylating dioxygenase subunit beta [Paenibacillus validus]MED4607491.1 aromatic-ring-hydroxylating dioxygenase subunit beta [Paenibacillus validus]MUG69874.1 hypothetical protein [Paenibacillus validus]